MVNVRSIKNDGRYFWTNHSKGKLIQYGLSPSVVKKTINHPERIEFGIAPSTTALMIRKDTKRAKKEIWVMIQKRETRNVKRETKIISAWIYPGVSPKGKEIYVPEDVWKELE
jgi:hypothetical protein